MKLGQYGLRNTILCSSVVPITILAVLLGLYFAVVRYQNLSANVTERTQSIMRQALASGRTALLNDDQQELRNLADALLADANIVSVSIFDHKKRLLTYAGPEMRPNLNDFKLDTHHLVMRKDKNVLHFTAPIRIKGTHLASHHVIIPHSTVAGWINLNVSLNEVYLKRFQSSALAFILVGFTILCSFLIALRLERRFLTPIQNLINASNTVVLGKNYWAEPTSEIREVATLENAVSALADKLKNTREELQEHVSQMNSDLKESLDTLEAKNIMLDIARKEAVEESRAKSEFVANISHELRAPMNGILGFTQLMLETSKNEEHRDYLMTIQKSATNLLCIINEVLDYSKIEAGHLVLDEVPLDIRDCIEEVLTLHAPAAQAKHLRMISEVSQKVPYKLLGDSLRLKQILTNFVNNAIKFTEQGDVKVAVQYVEGNERETKIKIIIKDNGIGLTQDEQKQLFHAFTQLDNEHARKQCGTGLGLVIAKQLIEKMRGKVGIESEPGEGATFWFTLVIQTIDDITQNSTLTRPLAKKTAWLFHQEQAIRDALYATLKYWGMHVTPFDDAEILLTRLQNRDVRQPDLVMSSHDNKLYQQYQSSSQPVIIITNAQDEDLHATDVPPDHIRYYQDDKLFKTRKLFQDTSELLQGKLAQAQMHQPKHLQVMVVDDEPINLKLMKILLQRHDIEVTTINNGTQAIRVADDIDFDIIFLDLQMPMVSGKHVTDQIRKFSAKNRNTPIIITSAGFTDKVRHQLVVVGVNDFLAKPITEPRLKSMIAKWTFSPVSNIEKTNKRSVKQAMAAAVIESISTDAEDFEAYKSFDIEEAGRLAGNNLTAAKEMFELLINKLDDERQQILCALAKEDLDLLESLIHRLRGALCYCGVPKLKEIVCSMHACVKQKEVAHFKALLPLFNREIEHLLSLKLETATTS